MHYTACGIITHIGGRLVHETATYMCDDTRGCAMQFCASSWLITEINILRCTVSKMSKKETKIPKCKFKIYIRVYFIHIKRHT